jgi:hypothetical protein
MLPLLLRAIEFAVAMTGSEFARLFLVDLAIVAAADRGGPPSPAMDVAHVALAFEGKVVSLM